MEGIYEFIAHDSPNNASQFCARILDSLEPLKQFPHRVIVQQKHPDLRYPARFIVVAPYLIYFRLLDDEKVVRVLHIRHAARRQPKRLE